MEHFIDIRHYRQQTSHVVAIGNLKRTCPIYNVGEDLWVVGNEHLCFGADVALTQRIGKLMAEKLLRFNADIVLTAASKSLGMVYELAKALGHEMFSVARKSIKPYQPEYSSTRIRSITSAKQEMLYLDDINRERLKEKKVILVDDVISTGSTMRGLNELAQSAGAEIMAIAAVWIEGPWPFFQFMDSFSKKSFVYLDVLPIYAKGHVYGRLNREKAEVLALLEDKMKC